MSSHEVRFEIDAPMHDAPSDETPGADGMTVFDSAPGASGGFESDEAADVSGRPGAPGDPDDEDGAEGAGGLPDFHRPETRPIHVSSNPGLAASSAVVGPGDTHGGGDAHDAGASDGGDGDGDDDDDRKGRRRSKTISVKQMPKRFRLSEDDAQVLRDAEAMRPRSREDCRHGERPCLFISCKYHLYLDVNPRTGSIKLNFPDKEVWELDQTCALDIAERGGTTLEEVGSILNLTRERVRQVEAEGLAKLREALDDDFIDE
jgi:hypothetical protein